MLCLTPCGRASMKPLTERGTLAVYVISPLHSSYERGCQAKTLLHWTSIVPCIQVALLRGEDFGSSARSATEYDRDRDRSCWSPLSGFMQRFRHHSLRSCASQPLASVPTIILCEARGLWLFWVIRGGIGLTRRLGADSSTRMPNERLDTLPRTRASQNRWATTEA